MTLILRYRHVEGFLFSPKFAEAGGEHEDT